ncbi:17628_t:CDS:2 [Gigaspora margarita]|uniref:17628_t:CDS:1 n=1 Tax=Gigaspora margarita TaxID=4874 RepID=A0ABN7UQ31_GIGMA|nr:17628_t:CDS:2 [Gigaspora margarita]
MRSLLVQQDLVDIDFVKENKDKSEVIEFQKLAGEKVQFEYKKPYIEDNSNRIIVEEKELNSVEFSEIKNTLETSRGPKNRIGNKKGGLEKLKKRVAKFL